MIQHPSRNQTIQHPISQLYIPGLHCNVPQPPSPAKVSPPPTLLSNQTFSSSSISSHIPPNYVASQPNSLSETRKARAESSQTTMATTLEFPCSISINIPLPTERLASTALQAIQVDKELSPLVRRTMSLSSSSSFSDDENAVLHVEYRATTNRMLRVAVNGFMESLRLVVEVMEHLDVDVLEQSCAAGANENTSSS